MEYTGKYKNLADQFQADGCDEDMVERFIREEMWNEIVERDGMTYRRFERMDG